VRRIMILTTSLLAAAALGSAIASAAPPPTTPNSAASGNCVATTSGVLFFRERDVPLGQDVSQFTAHPNPPGSQADFIQGQLAKQGQKCFP
jgi:hypothetical protein